MSMIWLVIAGLALLASMVFSAQSYALRLMSRVTLERELKRRGIGGGGEEDGTAERIWEARYNLGLAVSMLRLVVNIAVMFLGMLYFQERMYQMGAVGEGGGGAVPVLTFWGGVQGMLGSLLVTVPVLVVFSIAIPQGWAKYSGEGLIALTWPMLRWAGRVLYPVIAAMNLLDELIKRLAGVTMGDKADSEARQVEDEIMAAVSEGTVGGTVDEEQKKMIEGVISFRDLQVGQIMTPRTEIVALNVNATLADVQEKVIKDGLSRIPIYENTLDNVIGILYAKDLLTLLTPRGGGEAGTEGLGEGGGGGI